MTFRDENIMDFILKLYRSKDDMVTVDFGDIPFVVNPVSGSVQQAVDDKQKIHTVLAPEFATSVMEDINTAMRFVSKLKLIEQIKNLKDKAMNKVIDKHQIDVESGKNVSESATDMVLSKIMLEVKSPWVKVGLFAAPEKSRAQLAVYDVLHGHGIEEIKTYADVDSIMSSIQQNLNQAPQNRASSNRP